jgi:hypothetical protein
LAAGELSAASQRVSRQRSLRWRPSKDTGDRPQTESIIRAEKNLTDKVQTKPGEKPELWQAEMETGDLKSQLKLLTGMRRCLLSKQAEAGYCRGQVLAQPKRTLKQEETGHIPIEGSKVTSIVLDAAQEIVSPELFQRITDELTEVMNVIRSIIVVSAWRTSANP